MPPQTLRGPSRWHPHVLRKSAPASVAPTPDTRAQGRARAPQRLHASSGNRPVRPRGCLRQDRPPSQVSGSAPTGIVLCRPAAGRQDSYCISPCNLSQRSGAEAGDGPSVRTVARSAPYSARRLYTREPGMSVAVALAARAEPSAPPGSRRSTCPTCPVHLRRDERFSASTVSALFFRWRPGPPPPRRAARLDPRLDLGAPP